MFLSMTLCLEAAAVQLAPIGPTYAITEIDLLDQIASRLQKKRESGELARIEEDAKRRAIGAVQSPPPVAGLYAATVARTHYFDPTFTLQKNVLDAAGNVIFPAGFRKNPLEVVSMSKHLIFFDARDRRQVVLAQQLLTLYGGKVKPILTGGSYMDLMKSWRIPVYYDQGGLLTRRLGIAAVPAIVSQEGPRLRIDEMVAR
jgi:conjugal transfer pilus assembly protein TraW